jgi:hypothetical protein
MQRHIAPTFVRHDPGLPFEVRGPLGVAQLHDALLPAFPENEARPPGFRGGRRKGAGAADNPRDPYRGFGELAATGKRIEVPVLDLFQIRDGVLIEHWARLDNLGMMRQLSALPA